MGKKELVLKYYDQEAPTYNNQYKKNCKCYPSDQIRANIIRERLLEIKAETVFDVGCGSCDPMIKFLCAGLDVEGCDFSDAMLVEGKKALSLAGCSPTRIRLANIETGLGLPRKKFDAIVASGVFPHIVDEVSALNNIKKILNPNGTVFIEFRNELFAA